MRLNKETKSRLAPRVAKWRKRGRTFREIAERLKLTVSQAYYIHTTS